VLVKADVEVFIIGNVSMESWFSKLPEVDMLKNRHVLLDNFSIPSFSSSFLIIDLLYRKQEIKQYSCFIQ